ncbi:hypothetical protein COL154_000958 [Colletotrichum chrysophilum]|nr:hypothetical protein COL154_000958 [Colletotrichum chrysophilum]
MSAATKPPKDHFNVLFFASAGSFTSKQSEAFPAPLPLKKLFDMLEERYNGIKDKVLESCLVTVNLEVVLTLKGLDLTSYCDLAQVKGPALRYCLAALRYASSRTAKPSTTRVPLRSDASSSES